MKQDDLLQALGMDPGRFAPGATLMWLMHGEGPQGPVCSDALLTWEDDGAVITGSVVDRSGGAGRISVGFDAYRQVDGSFTVNATDGGSLPDEADALEVLGQFRTAVSQMQPSEA